MRAAESALRARPAPLPDWGARPHRVLFLRHDKIGDMITSTGILRAIAESHPTITLDVLASPSNAVVLAGTPFVHEVLVLDGVVEPQGPLNALRAAPALRARRYDAVVDGLVLSRDVSPLISMLLAASGAPRRIGVRECMGGPRVGVEAYTHLVDPPEDPLANHVECLQRLAGPFGVAPEDVPDPTLWLSADERDAAERVWRDADRAQHPPEEGVDGPRLLVNVSAGHLRRRWDDAQFVAAIRHVRAAYPGSTVAVVGEPAERAAVEGIAGEAGIAAPPTPSVRAAFGLVACADGVLTPDTAIAHVASAFRKPCVTLMHPGTGSEPFKPYRTAGRVVLSPTWEVRSIPVDEVTSALDDLFGLMAGRAGAGPAGRR